MSLHDRSYQSWLLQLQTWAADGRLVSAGVDALRLKPGQATDQLKHIANRLAKGETRDLPSIEVLPGSTMPGAAGAYASSDNTIYLNANWLESASNDQVIAVLNEELGHHLDAQLNNSDTAGDEGELFAILLSKETLESLNLDQLKAIRTEQDQGFIDTPDGIKSVEFAVITGTNTAETLTGTADADTITGGNEGKHATGDTIYGLGGADTLSGGSGFDWIYGGGGADGIYAGSVGGLGDATRNGLFGGEGNDLIYGGKKQDVLRGDGNQQGLEVPSNAGNDELYGGNGHDLITGGSGNDFLSGGQGDDYLDGGPGSDIIKAGPTGDAKSGRTDYYYQHDGHSTIWTGVASLTGSSTLINGETITFANGTDVIYGFHHSDDQLYLPGTTFNVINGGDNLNNLTIGSNYFIQGTWSISTSAAALSEYQSSNFSGSFTTGEDATDKDFLVLYDVKSESFFNTNNTNFLVLSFDDAGLDSSSSSEPADMVADPSESLRELPIRITGPSGDSGDSTVSHSMQDGNVDVHTFTNGSTAASKTTYWAVVGGDDESLFSINEATGALSFDTAPDFDNPTDSNKDNTYDIIIRASYSNETTSFSRSTDYRSVDVMQTIAITIDNTPPTIAITDDDANDSLSAGDTATLTFTLSEASTNFLESDVTISGGSLSSWTAVSSIVYTATFTPTDNSTTDGVISVASSKFSDSAGNNNNDGSDANNSVTFTVDTIRPTIAITDDDADDSLGTGDTATLTFTLSEAATDFVETDVAVSGGALSDWTAVSSTVYTATFTPTDNSTTDGVISVASSKFSDAVGNSNLDGSDANNSVTFTVNTTTPSPSPSEAFPSSLVLNEDNSFFVTEGSTQGLWINLKVTLADADLQNSLIIVDQNNDVLGAIGATRLSKNLGNHSIFIPEKSTIRFQQLSGNQSINDSPQLSTADLGSDIYSLQLDDSADDDDYNDLCIEVSCSSSSPAPEATTLAAEQLEVSDAIIDLTSIPEAGKNLKITVNSDADSVNRFGLVKLQQDSDRSFMVGGLKDIDGESFDDIVWESLVHPGENIITATGKNQEQYDWFVPSEEAGFYAPVLITQEDEIITYGSTEVKNLGCNFFGFEDQGSHVGCDWDYNDLTARIEVAGVSTLSGIF